MISKGSCDTDPLLLIKTAVIITAENSALHHGNELHLKRITIESSYFKL